MRTLVYRRLFKGWILATNQRGLFAPFREHKESADCETKDKEHTTNIEMDALEHLVHLSRLLELALCASVTQLLPKYNGII